MEIGKKDHINDVLEKFGTNKKVIFYVNGYGENMNPNDDNGEFSKYARYYIEDKLP